VTLSVCPVKVYSSLNVSKHQILTDLSSLADASILSFFGLKLIEVTPSWCPLRVVIYTSDFKSHRIMWPSKLAEAKSCPSELKLTEVIS